MDSVLFVLKSLSRTAPSARLRASSTRYGAAAFGGLRSLTSSSTRTTGSHAIKAAFSTPSHILKRREAQHERSHLHHLTTAPKPQPHTSAARRAESGPDSRGRTIAHRFCWSGYARGT